ncbi:MAG: hypothetical protein PHS41_05145 [Victivallaceae bacterium]|nr:hypothetical protein [Victivallaceae bacterium]
MKSKFVILAAVVTLGALLSGCAGMNIAGKKHLNGEGISASGQPIAHVSADNWGLYFFYFPLLTGSTDNPGTVAVLEDTVAVKPMMQMVSKKAKQLGASQMLDTVTFHGTPGWFFYFKSISVSTNAVR